MRARHGSGLRNAPVVIADGYMEVGPLRNIDSPDGQIVIVPLLAPPTAFLHRLRHIDRARIFPPNQHNPAIQVKILDIVEIPAELEIISRREPQEVTGARDYNYDAGSVIVRVDAPGTIRVKL